LNAPSTAIHVTPELGKTSMVHSSPREGRKHPWHADRHPDARRDGDRDGGADERVGPGVP